MREKNPIHQPLERIRIWIEREVPHIGTSLQTGISVAEMKKIMGTKSAQYRIPREIEELYKWRNGQSENVVLFGDSRFMPFEEAVEYADIVEEYSDGEFPLMVFQELDYDAGYRFKCKSGDEEVARAYRWMHGNEWVETNSLEDLLSAVAHGFDAGVFRPNGQGGFETDDGAWESILIRHHPDRPRGVNAVLQRKWDALSAEELQSAFNDLARSKHGDTAACVRDYLADTSHVAESNFENIWTVLGIGIFLRDSWSRDFAWSLVLGNDKRLRGAGLSNLAWSWRGDLTFSPEIIDALMDQIGTSQLSDHENRERAMLLGRSGDRRSARTLLRLLNVSDEDCASRDTRIAAVRALGQLGDSGVRGVCLAIATGDADPGTRITAIRALLDLGFDDAEVETAAKAHIRRSIEHFRSPILENEHRVLRRWIDEVIHS